jgi:DNA-binding protein H-NS
MTNLVDIQGQIDKLQKQADDIKARDFDKTIADILAKMRVFGITLKDLTPKKRVGVRGKVGAKAFDAQKKAGEATIRRSGPVAAKFIGPNGETWSGRGLMPRWLSALVAQGQSKEDFAVKS